jgi:hypothetical protein
LPRCARIAVMLGEDCRHALAVLHALPRRRRQKLHRHLRADFARAHLLLNRFRQKLDQRQPPRHPAHTSIKPPRQILQAVAESLLHLRQQPAHFQRGLMFGKAQRTIQQHRGGFAHRPHHRFHRVAPELLQRRDSFIAVDHHVAIRHAFHRDHYDRHLLAAVSQRGQQPATALRVVHSQLFPAALQLMKFQLHRPFGIQYAGGANWSFPLPGEVG